MKIICIGRNYVDHANELNNPIPEKPLIFMKPSTALLLDGKAFYYPDFSNNIHYELELVLKIKKNGRQIQPHFARDYYSQIGLGIDFTARDIQDQCKEKGHPWEIAKAFDNSAVLGEFRNISEMKDVHTIKFQLLKNGIVVQAGDSKDLIFNFNYLIVYISQFFTLNVGDLIYTGTPAGVGPVTKGDLLEGMMDGQKVLECAVK